MTSSMSVAATAIVELEPKILLPAWVDAILDANGTARLGTGASMGQFRHLVLSGPPQKNAEFSQQVAGGTRIACTPYGASCLDDGSASLPWVAMVEGLWSPIFQELLRRLDPSSPPVRVALDVALENPNDLWRRAAESHAAFVKLFDAIGGELVLLHAVARATGTKLAPEIGFESKSEPLELSLTINRASGCPLVQARIRATEKGRFVRLLVEQEEQMYLLSSTGASEKLQCQSKEGKTETPASQRATSGEAWWQAFTGGELFESGEILIAAARQTQKLMDQWLYPRRSINHYRDTPPLQLGTKLPQRFAHLPAHPRKARTWELRELRELRNLLPSFGSASVHLVRTPTIGRFDPLSLVCPPLALGQLSGMLEHFDVEVSCSDHHLLLNGRETLTLEQHQRFAMLDPTRPGWEQAVDAELRQVVERAWANSCATGANANLVGISLEDASSMGYACILADVVQSRSGARVVLGGAGLFEIPTVLEACPWIYGAVIGDGDLALPAVVAHLKGKLPKEEVPGFVYRGKGRTRSNFQLFHYRTALPCPAYPGLDLTQYYAAERFGRGELETRPTRMVPYISERGCPYLCAYCGDVTDRYFDIEPVPNTISHLQRLKERHHCDSVYFINHLLNAMPGYLEEFVGGMIEADLGLQWTDCFRVDRLPVNMAADLRAAGCARMVWGLDCVSQRLQEIHRKRIPIRKSLERLVAFREAGIHVMVNLICGVPHQSDEDLDEFDGYMKEYGEIVDRVVIHKYRYADASPVYQNPRAYGLRREGDIFHEVGGLPWYEKRMQIDRHFNRILEICDANGVLCGQDPIPSLKAF